MCSDHKTLYEIQNPTLNIFFSFYSIQQKEPKDFKNEKNLQILTTLTYKSLLNNKSEFQIRFENFGVFIFYASLLKFSQL